MEREERRRIVLANIKSGTSYRTIAEHLGVSVGTVAADVKIILERLKKESLKDAEQHRRIECQRIDHALNALWPKISGGDIQAINTMVRLMERRAKLLGLDEQIGTNDNPIFMVEQTREEWEASRERRKAELVEALELAQYKENGVSESNGEHTSPDA